ncbi:triose-phosphate isomerase [Lapillicoccus sp.]|uniref:triose-phosphate isomerase n=1 Tax=Lapillicoccus sp. TaxID=1909287 RepID=UPI0039835A33
MATSDMLRSTVWVGTSWKMNKTLDEARSYIDEVCGATVGTEVQLFVLPAHTALAAVRDRMPRGNRLLLGAQNAHWGPEGAGTGEISMRMAKDAGARIVEMGHSERREHFGETDATVAAKASAALDHALIPLICVGEPLAVLEAGDAWPFVSAQVRAALAAVQPAQVADILVAYEPVWAIGAGGRRPTTEQVAPVMASLSQLLAELGEGRPPRALLYGGSVDESNAVELLAIPHTDGLFVGRAGWDAARFLSVAAQAASTVAVP